MAAYGRLCTLFHDADKPRASDAEVAWYAERLPRDSGPSLEVMSGSGRLLIPLLQDVFHFHPLSIEDTLNPDSRVKVDEYDGYIFITARVVNLCEETPDDPYDLKTTNLYLYIGKHYLVTVHAGPSLHVDALVDVVTRNPDVLSRTLTP